MAQPIKVAREQNLSVSLWENGKYKNVKVSMGYPTKETKELPREQREYKHKEIQINQEQVKTLIKLLEQVQ